MSNVKSGYDILWQIITVVVVEGDVKSTPTSQAVQWSFVGQTAETASSFEDLFYLFIWYSVVTTPSVICIRELQFAGN